MRISDWSSDVCSSDLSRTLLLEAVSQKPAHFRPFCRRFTAVVELSHRGSRAASNLTITPCDGIIRQKGRRHQLLPCRAADEPAANHAQQGEGNAAADGETGNAIDKLIPGERCGNHEQNCNCRLQCRRPHEIEKKRSEERRGGKEC